MFVQSLLAISAGALWDGKSLTPTVESKQGRESVSAPAQCVDTHRRTHTHPLLLSAVSQAERQRQKGRRRHREWRRVREKLCFHKSKMGGTSAHWVCLLVGHKNTGVFVCPLMVAKYDWASSENDWKGVSSAITAQKDRNTVYAKRGNSGSDQTIHGMFYWSSK